MLFILVEAVCSCSYKIVYIAKTKAAAQESHICPVRSRDFAGIPDLWDLEQIPRGPQTHRSPVLLYPSARLCETGPPRPRLLERPIRPGRGKTPFHPLARNLTIGSYFSQMNPINTFEAADLYFASTRPTSFGYCEELFI